MTGGLSPVCSAPRPPVSVPVWPTSPAVRLAYVSASGWWLACGQGAPPAVSVAFQVAAGGARVSRPMVNTVIHGCEQWWASAASGFLDLCPGDWCPEVAGHLRAPGSLFI